MGGTIPVAVTLTEQSPSTPPTRSYPSYTEVAEPQRLSQATHDLARRTLSGEFGRSMQRALVELSDDERAGLSPNMQYARATLLAAHHAPLRILPGELIVGAATLLEAPMHSTPILNIASTSHTTIGFHRVLETGYRGLREQIRERLSQPGLDERGVDLLDAMSLCLDAAEVWHRRHIEELSQRIEQSSGEERAGYVRVRDALAPVPDGPPETFHQAVQSVWFLWAFQRLMGNWSGLGRLDEMWGPYLARDLDAGAITLDEAREIVAHFWIKGAEWTGAPSCFGGSGDAQFYQNVVLGGVDEEGNDVTNEVTYLILDVVEEFHISDFPIAVRLNANSPERLLRKMAMVQRHGGGIIAAYNENVVIDGLVRFGYALPEARTFTNDGCWEVLIPGRTRFGYHPFDVLSLLHGVLGLHTPDEPEPDYATLDELVDAWAERVRAFLDEANGHLAGYANGGHPSPLLSLLVEDCIERGRGYDERGARYNVLAPHAGGMANVANSLLVIKTLVYDERRLTLPEFVAVLRRNWEGHEDLRQLVRNRFGFYGNDDAEADAMMARVFSVYTDLVRRTAEVHGVLRPAGISTFGREIGWAHPDGDRKASPDGHLLGAVLATNFSPSPGTDTKGPTAALKSYCKMDFTRTPNGATLELKVHPDAVRGEDGVEALVGLLRTFVRLGGMYVHIDAVDTKLLLDAQAHPDRYPNLVVRISGWSARFATLDTRWQDMVIQRTQQLLGR